MMTKQSNIKHDTHSISMSCMHGLYLKKKNISSLIHHMECTWWSIVIDYRPRQCLNKKFRETDSLHIHTLVVWTLGNASM